VSGDVRYGFRLLAKNPGFMLLAVLALVLGIRANTTIIGVINSRLKGRCFILIRSPGGVFATEAATPTRLRYYPRTIVTRSISH
jgi:hypothetical protein